MIKSFFVSFLVVSFPVFCMDLQQAYECFKNDRYEDLFRSQPADTNVVNFCKVFSEKMKEDQKKQGKSELVIPSWALGTVDSNVAKSFAPIAIEKGQELLSQWQPKRARLWLHFSESLGSPSLFEEEERYIESMIRELKEYKYTKVDEYDELLKGLDKIGDFYEGDIESLPVSSASGMLLK